MTANSAGWRLPAGPARELAGLLGFFALMGAAGVLGAVMGPLSRLGELDSSQRMVAWVVLGTAAAECLLGFSAIGLLMCRRRLACRLAVAAAVIMLCAAVALFLLAITTGGMLRLFPPIFLAIVSLRVISDSRDDELAGFFAEPARA